VSVVETLARIAEIQSALAPPQPAPSAAPASAFAAELQTARATPGTAVAHSLSLSATAAGPVEPGALPPDLAPLVRQAAEAHGVDPALVAAVARAESNFNPAAVSPAGAQGLMQLMPGTARGLGVTDPFDPMQSLGGGARYLRAQLDRFGDPALALAAYNAGPGAVSRAGGIPPYAETQAYVRRVLGYYEGFRAQGLA